MTHQALISPPRPVDISDMAHRDSPPRHRARLPLVGQLLLGAGALISAASAVPAMGARSPAYSATSTISRTSSSAASSPDAGSDPATVARHLCYRLLADDTAGAYRGMNQDEIALRHAEKAPDEDWAATYQGCGEGLGAWADEAPR